MTMTTAEKEARLLVKLLEADRLLSCVRHSIGSLLTEVEQIQKGLDRIGEIVRAERREGWEERDRMIEARIHDDAAEREA